MSRLRKWAMIFSLGRKLRICCATCLTRSSWKLYKIVPRACCRSLRRTILLRLHLRFFQYQQVPVGSASRLRCGNQAKKACCFKVSVLGSHVGPGAAKSDSFLCSFLRPPPTSSFTGVVAGTGMALSLASGSFSSVSAGIDGSCLTETKDHEMDGAGGSAEMQTGRPPL